MNPETGRIYEGADEIEAARERDEPLIELSPSIVEELNAKPSPGPRNRAERRALRFGGARGRSYERSR